LVKSSRKNEVVVAVEYYTEAPVSLEERIDNGKRVIISAPSELGYENITAYSYIDNVKISKKEIEVVGLYWDDSGERKKIIYDYFDSNEDGYIDLISWIVPHLSEQIYEIDLKIISLKSYPMIGRNWTVQFNTTGLLICL
jgi:hypothetical protein